MNEYRWRRSSVGGRLAFKYLNKSYPGSGLNELDVGCWQHHLPRSRTNIQHFTASICSSVAFTFALYLFTFALLLNACRFAPRACRINASLIAARVAKVEA
ncbi:MAG: hypothetical protein H0W76_03235 [Pyrinomonadaceae bacterium]|nr:hypothetical protein [Pyrinomonadaceae bacterium]